MCKHAILVYKYTSVYENRSIALNNIIYKKARESICMPEILNMWINEWINEWTGVLQTDIMSFQRCQVNVDPIGGTEDGGEVENVAVSGKVHSDFEKSSVVLKVSSE